MRRGSCPTCSTTLRSPPRSSPARSAARDCPTSWARWIPTTSRASCSRSSTCSRTRPAQQRAASPVARACWRPRRTRTPSRSRWAAGGQVRAALRSARRIVEHRRQRPDRHDLLDPSPDHPGRRAGHPRGLACSRAARRWRPATSSTARARCSCTPRGSGVHGFTLDPSIGEFLLSHPQIVTPAVGTSTA